MARLISILVLLLAIGTNAVAQELLEPEKAFQFSARLLDARQVEIKYVIAPGYYLYREKFKFTAEPASVSVDATQLPPGKVKKDEFFGEVQTYRGELRFVLPVQGLAAQAPQFTLKAVSQGCADIGVCYPPQEQTANVTLAAFSPAGAATPSTPFLANAPPARAAGPQSEDALIAGLFKGGFWVLIASFFGFGLLLALTPWKNSSRRRGISKCRYWPTASATRCIWATATARCSGGTRKSSRRRRRPA